MLNTNPKDYVIKFGKIDESGQIIIVNRGIKTIGCPNCGAIFVHTCYCGFAKLKNN